MAVTCDDFVDAMQEASGKDLSQVRRWYEQAGTPIISMDTTFNEASGQLDMTLTQRNPPTPGQDSKPPLHIPVAVSLLVDWQHHKFDDCETQRVLELTNESEKLSFTGLSKAPVVSVLRCFSAPVRL